MAIVGDLQGQYPFLVRQFNVHLAGLRVLGDIGQCFLGSTVCHQLDVGGYIDGFAAALHPCGDARPALKALGQPLDSRHQPLFQDGWAQVHHDALAGANRVLQHVHRRGGMLLHGRIGTVAPYPGHVKAYCGQCATNVVVDLASDGGPLMLDGGLQMLGQLGQAALRRGQLGNSLLARVACFVHFQGPGNYMREALDIVLEQIVRYPEPHRVNRCGLANGT